MEDYSERKFLIIIQLEKRRYYIVYMTFTLSIHRYCNVRFTEKMFSYFTV